MAKKARSKQKEKLFEETLVPSKPGSGKLFDVSYDDESQPVECLGMTFENDEARRQYFLERLREKLQDPEFRKIEGFPIGEDEDILALSDPPYYTACPNPFLDDYIHSVHQSESSTQYHREPFAADVSEGRNDALYNAHRYHTKVPYKAIIHYLLHYTRPNDIVLDAFCGSGMTGAATQLCNDRTVLSELGYHIDNSGAVTDAKGKLVTHAGPRHCIEFDLSPIATFISYNQGTPIEPDTYDGHISHVVQKSEREYGWLYDTLRDKGRKSQIYHTVWSEVLICDSCGSEITFWEAAVDQDSGEVSKDFECPHCDTLLNKRSLDRAQATVFDDTLKKAVKKAKYRPVAIRENVRGSRAERPLTDFDAATIERVNREAVPFWYPTDSIERDIDMWYERDYRSLGLYTLDGFYTKRNLLALASLWSNGMSAPHGRIRNAVLFTLTGMAVNVSRMNCWRPNVSFPYNPISGTLYVPALPVESNVFHGVRNKAKRLKRLWDSYALNGDVLISTQSSADMQTLSDETIDYIFTDPPFGSNIIYSDLSLLYEGWLKVSTQTDSEAVVHRRKKTGKRLNEYREAMSRCFSECHRVLKSGRWITVVFHNTKNSVWNAIQEALNEAGFVVADVRILDKKLGSFKQLTAAGAVKKDLIISAYRPLAEVEEHFSLTGGSEAGAWEFVDAHLSQLPVFVTQKGQLEVLAERQDYLLFDRMVAFHVQRGVTVPLSASEFYAGLRRRYPERDNMFFLPPQAAEYDKKRVAVSEVQQLELFVSDETTAIQWLKRYLAAKPQTFSELQPQFMREVGGWEKHEKPLELSEMLEQNFLCYDGSGDVPSQIHSYLSSNFHELRSLDKSDSKLISKAKNRWYVPDPRKETDLERVRHRALMREFDEYRESKGKLKVVRTEALRAGFKECWQNGDYETIVDLANRVKDDIIQEDPALLMYYDNASLRTED